VVGIIALHTCEIKSLLGSGRSDICTACSLFVCCLVCACDFLVLGWVTLVGVKVNLVVSVMAIIKGEGDEPLQICCSWETLDRKKT